MSHRSWQIMPSYYDLILGLIPVALFGLAGTLTIAGVQLTVAVPAAALVAVGLIGHALFVNGPVDPTPSRSATSTASTSSKQAAPTSD